MLQALSDYAYVLFLGGPLSEYCKFRLFVQFLQAPLVDLLLADLFSTGNVQGINKVLPSVKGSDLRCLTRGSAQQIVKPVALHQKLYLWCQYLLRHQTHLGRDCYASESTVVEGYQFGD